MRLLVLTHTFPPSPAANAKRPFYLVKGFLNAGWQVDVVTSWIGVQAGAAEALTHPALRVVRCGDPANRFCQLFARNFRVFKAVSLAVHAVMWPDEFVLWSLQALRFVRKHAQDYAAVVVFLLPASLLLAGKMVGPRWIFDMQESVTPYFQRVPRRSPLLRTLLPLLRRIERRTLHRAGRVLFTADTNRRAYVQQRLVKEEATAHVPYFFDAGVFQEPRPTDPVSPEFQVVYFGMFDWRGNRSPQTFLQSLAQFLQQRPEARLHTRFLFYGNWLPEHDQFLEDLRLRDVVRIQPPVPYEQYLQELKRSPILLLVVSSAHSLFMPSKIVDYFGARRPILAFVPRESEMRQVLEKAGMADYACDESDTAAGAAALERLWQRYRAGGLAPQTDRTEFWSSQTQIPRYLDFVQNCASNQ